MDIQIKKLKKLQVEAKETQTGMHYNETEKSKTKRNLKATRNKQCVIYKRASVRLQANFPGETLQTKRQWDDMFEALKENKNKTTCQPRFQINKLTLHLKELDSLPLMERMEDKTSGIPGPAQTVGSECKTTQEGMGRGGGGSAGEVDVQQGPQN